MRPIYEILRFGPCLTVPYWRLSKPPENDEEEKKEDNDEEEGKRKYEEDMQDSLVLEEGVLVKFPWSLLPLVSFTCSSCSKSFPPRRS